MSGLSLLAPLGLLALIGVPLVVLFHMRNTTPRVLSVPTLRFWREAQIEENETVRFRRPPLSLLLALHLALVALIALALARPISSSALGGLGGRTMPRHLILLLDGSTSMAAAVDPLGPAGRTRFDLARQEALDELDDLHEGDVATVLVLGTHTTTLEATDGAGLHALRERIRALPLPGGRADLNGALRLCQDLLLPGMTDTIVLVSDGADGADPNLVSRIGAPVELRAVGQDAPSGNVAITDLVARGSPDNPGQQQLYVRVVNFSDTPATVPITVTADGLQVAERTLQLDPNGGAEELVQDLPSGAAAASVTIDSSDALQADDTASVLLAQAGAAGLRIVLVSDSATTLQRALAVLPGAQVTSLTLTELTAGGLPGPTDLIVFEGSTPSESFPDLPALVVNPLQGAFRSTGTVADPKPVRLRSQDPILKGVDLAGVVFGQIPVHELDADAVEVVGAEGGPLIYRGWTPGTGQPMVVLTFDINQSNLAQRVAFPILIANIAQDLAPSALPASSPLGDPLTYRPRAGASSVRFTNPAGTTVDLPALEAPAGAASGAALDRAVSFSETGIPGEYVVTELDANGGELTVSRLVINAGHPRESDLRPNAELPGTLAMATGAEDVGRSTSLQDLWPALVVLAIGLLTLEWVAALWPARRRRFATTGGAAR